MIPSTDILGLARIDINDVNNIGVGEPDMATEVLRVRI